MPEADPFAAFEPPPEQAKPTRKHTWRSKLNKLKEEKAIAKLEKINAANEQVDAFLGSSRTSSTANLPANSDALSRPGIPNPRIDVSVSQRSSDDAAGSPHHALPPLSSALPIHTKPKKARKGLKVKWSLDPPDVIGEGGDEAELPTKDVCIQRSRSPSLTLAKIETTPAPEGQSPTSYIKPPPELHLDTGFGPGPQLGTAPGAGGDEWKPPLMQDTQDSDFLMAVSMMGKGSRLSLRESDDPNSFARRVQAKMRAEEGEALSRRLKDEAPSPVRENEPDLQQQQPSFPLDPSTPISPVGGRADLSLRTSPARLSPQRISPEQKRPARVEDGLPSSLSPGGGALPAYVRSAPFAPESASWDQTPPQEKSPESAQSTPPAPPPHASAPPMAKMSLRSLTSAIGDNALTEFATRVDQFSALFRLSAENMKPIMETSLEEWVRASAWWFLKGRADLEVSIRSRGSNSGSPTTQRQPDQTQQAVVDLAKAWWMNQHIIPQHPELAKYGKMGTDGILAIASTTGDQKMTDLLGLHQAIIGHLRALAMSMKRNNILPNSSGDPVMGQNVDSNIWIKYPFFTPDVSSVLSGATKSMVVDRPAKRLGVSDMMPMGDTGRFFNYGRMFVDVGVSSSEDDSQLYSIPCVLSIIRDKADWYVTAAIASQSELVNLMIQPDPKKGPTWEDVDWHVKTHSMNVRLPRGFELDIQFKEPDFKTIWNIVKYTRKTEGSLHAESGEILIYENVLKLFQYMDTGTPKAFPAEPSERCRLRVFEKQVTLTEGTGKRKAHRGFRIAVVTSPKVKTLSSVRHTLAQGSPIVFGYLRGDDGAPAMLLKVDEEGRSRSMVLTFHEPDDRTQLHSLLLGNVPGDDEVQLPDVAMRSFSIEQPAKKAEGTEAVTHVMFSAPSASVTNRDPRLVDHGYGSTILSENLRIFVNAKWGSVTDRINLGPGELQIGLDVKIQTQISILRQPQEDLTVSVAENMVPKEFPDEMTRFLKVASSEPTVRCYNFLSLSDLHQFQAAVTGFNVLYDGFVPSFAISRRRMVVPIYKKLEATVTRLQVIRQEKTTQLLAFFGDFNHGNCMNFVLKSTDLFEQMTPKSGKPIMKIVDAKFALPKHDGDIGSNFVCLDMPEYPSEHDDITITFDSDSERQKFRAVMPGAVRDGQQRGSLRR